MLTFGHFGLKIGPLWIWNLTPNPWDYETRAQELTSGAIRILLLLFVQIWELFKDGRVWGFFYQMNLVDNFDIFYNFHISLLWMDQYGWNWWQKIFWCSESGNIFDRYNPWNFWEILEAGAKNCFSVMATLDTKFGHVNMLKHINLAEFQRSVDMVKWHFLVILVILGSKSDHFPLWIWPKICEIMKLELKS